MEEKMKGSDLGGEIWGMYTHPRVFCGSVSKEGGCGRDRAEVCENMGDRN
jgi:hypothetical protein